MLNCSGLGRFRPCRCYQMHLGKWCTDLQEMPRRQDMGGSEMDFDGRHLTLLFVVRAASQGVGDTGSRCWSTWRSMT